MYLAVPELQRLCYGPYVSTGRLGYSRDSRNQISHTARKSRIFILLENQIVALETLAQLSYRKTLGPETFSRNEELEEVTSDTTPRGLGRWVHRKCVCFTRMKSWVWTPRTQIKGQAWWQMPVTPSLSRWETEGNDLWKSVGHLAWHAEFQANKIPVTN